MLLGAKIRLHCEISKWKMTPVKFEQFRHNRYRLDIEFSIAGFVHLQFT
jgi:hypothetical protein